MPRVGISAVLPLEILGRTLFLYLPPQHLSSLMDFLRFHPSFPLFLWRLYPGTSLSLGPETVGFFSPFHHFCPPRRRIAPFFPTELGRVQDILLFHRRTTRILPTRATTFYMVPTILLFPPTSSTYTSSRGFFLRSQPERYCWFVALGCSSSKTLA